MSCVLNAKYILFNSMSPNILYYTFTSILNLNIAPMLKSLKVYNKTSKKSPHQRIWVPNSLTQHQQQVNLAFQNTQEQVIISIVDSTIHCFKVSTHCISNTIQISIQEVSKLIGQHVALLGQTIKRRLSLEQMQQMITFAC